jgi:hypothetical protein
MNHQEAREGDLTGSRRGNQSSRKPMPRLTLRIDFDGARAVGPGKIKLMEMIDKHGSISEAARQIGMSYRRAWLLVDSLNRCFRVPVVPTRRHRADIITMDEIVGASLGSKVKEVCHGR